MLNKVAGFGVKYLYFFNNIEYYLYFCAMIQVLKRSFDILDFLALNQGDMVTLSQIEEACGIQKTTLSNILKTLEGSGYVTHPRKRKGYRLGYKFYIMAGSQFVFRKLEEISADEMRLLYDIFKETIVLATEHGGKRLVLKVVECPEGITARISHSDDLYESATGRVMLANYPENKVRTIVSQIGLPSQKAWSDALSPEALKRELALIRKEGFSITSDHLDIIGIAVPILCGSDPVASLGVCLPKFRCTTSKITLIRNVLDECALSLGKKITETDFTK